MFVKTNHGLVEMPDLEPVEFSITKEEYPAYVAMKIHEVYSLDDEIAILRQKDEKPDEYAKYYSYCEAVKTEAKALIKNN